jgi:hypothetical protein
MRGLAERLVDPAAAREPDRAPGPAVTWSSQAQGDTSNLARGCDKNPLPPEADRVAGRSLPVSAERLV